MYNSLVHFRTESRLYSLSYRIQDQPCISLLLRATTCHPKRATPREPPQESHPMGRLRRPLWWRRSRVVTFTAIRLRGPGFKSWPGQKFENENFCFRRTPAVLKACHLCRMRPIKTRSIKPEYLSYPTKIFYVHTVQEGYLSISANKDLGRSVIMIASE